MSIREKKAWIYLDGLVAKNKAKSGYKAKIVAKCIDCIVDPLARGTWRQQVENCASPDCPLYEVRPRTINADK